jgi:hypothetical protein
VIQLYAFVRGLRGGGPDELEAVEIGTVAAIVGDVHEDPVRHGLAVQSLLDDAEAVLPARFGERFADAEALRVAVRPLLTDLEHRLETVAECVELAVRVARTSGEGATRASDGGSYLRARFREVTADAAVADSLHALLQRRSLDAVVADRLMSKLVHDACYLVEREGVETFSQCVAEYAAAHPDFDLVCTGPWAPASFAGTPA